MNPSSLSIDELHKLLAAAGGAVIVEQLEDDFEVGGAPRNADGSVNIVHYVAWLVREANVK